MKLESNFNVGDVVYVCYSSLEGGRKHIVLTGPIVIDSMEMKLTQKTGQMTQAMVVYKTSSNDIADNGFFTEEQAFCTMNHAVDQFTLLRNK
jgi:hypothetical protein